MTTLQQELDRWEAALADTADTSTSEDWRTEERRLAEARQTIVAYHGRILPAMTGREMYDGILTEEITRLVDGLEELRDDLLRTAHAADAQQIPETIAALRALTRLAVRFDDLR